MNRFLAKTEPVQTIVEHTREMLNHLQTLKKKYPALLDERGWVILEKAIVFHDLGKVNTLFQNKLYGSLKLAKIGDPSIVGLTEVPHNYLSVALMDFDRLKSEFADDELEILYNTVARHHYRKRMPEIDNEVFGLIDEHLEKTMIPHLEHFTFPEIQEYICPCKSSRKYDKLLFEKRFLKRVVEDAECFRRYALIKGLLNRIDYVASSGEADMIEYDFADEHGETLPNKVEKKWPNLRDIQVFAKANKEKNLIVVASTGIGKTEAAFLWFGRQKGFFTLPLKTSINAIFDRIVSEEGYGYAHATLLHGDAKEHLMAMGESFEDAERQYRVGRLFAYPVTVCTVDQLFTFVFKYPNSEILLSSLASAKVVIDEIQMYDPRVLASILYGLKWIVDMGGKFAIFTATLPKILPRLLEEEGIVGSHEYTQYQALDDTKRHWVEFCENEDIPIEEINRRGQDEKVLVIVNRISKAQELFSQVKGCEVHLLHSHFIKKDRKKLETEIMRFSKDAERAGVWISTQIVEASLDIDFDVLYTSMTSCDSLMQRMGRVYRKREYLANGPNVFIYDNSDGKGRVIDREIYDFTIEALKTHGQGLMLEERKQELMDLVFDPDKNENLIHSSYYIAIKEHLQILKSMKYGYFDKKEAQKFFRNIDSKKFIPRSILFDLELNGTSEKWANMRASKNKKDIHEAGQELEWYTVNLSFYNQYHYERLDESVYGKDLYVIDLDYDFDESGFFGQGLIKKTKEEFAQTDHSNVV